MTRTIVLTLCLSSLMACASSAPTDLSQLPEPPGMPVMQPAPLPEVSCGVECVQQFRNAVMNIAAKLDAIGIVLLDHASEVSDRHSNIARVQ